VCVGVSVFVYTVVVRVRVCGRECICSCCGNLCACV
jgi:hypothetical protein